MYLLRFAGYFVFLLTFFYASLLQAGARLENVSFRTEAGKTTAVLELNKASVVKTFSLKNPARFVIDLKSTVSTAKKIASIPTPILNVRYGIQPQQGLRIVFEHDEKSQITFSAKNPSRLEVEFTSTIARQPTPPISKAEKTIAEPPERSSKIEKNVHEPNPLALVPRRSFTVAIDPGHGGDDPGAKGPRGIREKDVVLAIAKKLALLINDDPRMRAFLIRDRDEYIGLRQRMQIARKKGADLFVSVHADAYHHPRAKGASVFVLSERGGSSEAARWLAAHENRADLVGGLSLDNKSDVVASVLIDMSQSATKVASSHLASRILMHLKQITHLHKPSVERAGFMVLKSPDIPSVLVETGFISNPEGERNLSHPTHQLKIARAIHNGIQEYLQTAPFLAMRAEPLSSGPQMVASRRH